MHSHEGKAASSVPRQSARLRKTDQTTGTPSTSTDPFEKKGNGTAKRSLPLPQDSESPGPKKLKITHKSADAQELITKHSIEITKFMTKIEEVQGARAAAEHGLNQKDQELQVLEHEAVTLREDRSSLENHIEDLSKTANVRKEEIAMLKEKVEEQNQWRQEADDRVKEIVMLKAKVAERDQWRQEAEDRTEEINMLKAIIKEQDQWRQDCCEELDSMQPRNDWPEPNDGDLQRDLNDLERTIYDFSTEYAAKSKIGRNGRKDFLARIARIKQAIPLDDQREMLTEQAWPKFKHAKHKGEAIPLLLSSWLNRFLCNEIFMNPFYFMKYKSPPQYHYADAVLHRMFMELESSKCGHY